MANKTKLESDDEIKLLRRRIAALEKLNEHYKELEDKLNEARMFAENIVETVRQPLLVMDGNLKVVSANKSFYDVFKVSTAETLGKFVYELGNGQWNIPELRQILKEIIAEKNTLDDYVIKHQFETIGLKVMLLSARRIPPTPARPRIILLAIEDITERTQMQKEESAVLEKKVSERTMALDEANRKLQEKISELEVFNKAAVGRELKIIELKKEVEELRKKTE